MNTTIYILAVSLVVAIGFLMYFAYNAVAYRILTIKLTRTIKSFYCEFEDCKLMKYYSTPDSVDKGKGTQYPYCSNHLAKDAEGTLNEKIYK